MCLLVFLVIVLPGRLVLPKIPVVGPYFTSFYKSVDGLSVWRDTKWGNGAEDLYFPEGKNSYPKMATRPHFKEKKAVFVLLTHDAQAYASPTENATETLRLKAGARVMVTYTLPQETWSFVIDPETLKPIGWCLDSVLGYQDRFSPVSTWDTPYFGMCIGEYCAEFRVSDTGVFTMSWEAIGQGLQLSGTGHGQLYEYRGLIWVKQANSANLDELLMRDPAGGLMHELRRRKEPIQIVSEKEAPLRKTKRSIFSL